MVESTKRMYLLTYLHIHLDRLEYQVKLKIPNLNGAIEVYDILATFMYCSQVFIFFPCRARRAISDIFKRVLVYHAPASLHLP